jgi:hypothetical protein
MAAATPTLSAKLKKFAAILMHYLGIISIYRAIWSLARTDALARSTDDGATEQSVSTARAI